MNVFKTSDGRFINLDNICYTHPPREIETLIQGKFARKMADPGMTVTFAALNENGSLYLKISDPGDIARLMAELETCTRESREAAAAVFRTELRSTDF